MKFSDEFVSAAILGGYPPLKHPGPTEKEMAFQFGQHKNLAGFVNWVRKDWKEVLYKEYESGKAYGKY